MSDTQFSAEEWLRYTRHLQLPQMGVAGQQKLKQSHVLIVGAGGLGSPVSLYLAAAGVGQLTIVDGDTVDFTNLQRQILFSVDQVGQPKVEAARKRLLALNDCIDVIAVAETLSLNNVDDIFAGIDLVIDCTDNFATRYLINDTCVRLSLPWIFASIYQFSGQCALFTPDSACFRCLFPKVPSGVADCNTAGVLGVLPGLLGCIQANEAIKYLTGLSSALENRLCLVEAMDLSFRSIQLAKNDDCKVCGRQRSPVSSEDYQIACTAVAMNESSISVSDFLNIKQNDSTLILDVRTPTERAAFHIGGEPMPLDSIKDSALKLDKNKIIVCYCQSGLRSQAACRLLIELGFQAKSLEGGIVRFLKETDQ